MRIAEAHSIGELVAALDEERNYRMEMRRGMETIWWNNILLLAGDHYAQWDPTKNRVSGPSPRSSATGSERRPPRTSIVLNHALTVQRTEMAKLAKNRPIMQAMAASDDANDIKASQVAIKVLDSLEYKFKLRSLRKKALRWTTSCGISGVGVFWDPWSTKDGYIEYAIDPETGVPVHDEEQKATLLDMYEQGSLEKDPREYIPLGDIDYRLYSPFQLLPDPTTTDWDDIDDIITIDVVHRDKLAKLYGAKVIDVGPDEVTLGTMEKRALYRSGLTGRQNQQIRDAMYVYTYWLKPGVYDTGLLKHGKMVRWIKNNTLLDHTKTFPFTDKQGRGELPFAFFPHIMNEASIWPDSIIQHIRGPNLEMDKTASQLLENKDYLCNPMWRRAAQHRMKGQVKNVPGAEVVYHHVPNIPPPEPIPGIPLPAQVENILVYLRDQILDISGQGETSRGRVPSGVRAGVMIEYLQEEDDTRLAPTTENLEDFVARISNLSLQRCQQFYTTERLMRYTNDDAQIEIFSFQGSDLPDNTDVICLPGSAFPKMKAAKQQFILDLVQMGVETDPKRVRDLLEIGGAQPDEVDLARSQARREHTQMIQFEPQQPDPQQQMMEQQGGMNGQPPDPSLTTIIPKMWHNHEVHLKEHYGFMSTPEYEQMVVQNPVIDQTFSQHAMLHEQFKLFELQQQMMMATAAKGAPSESGAGFTSPTGAEGQAPEQIEATQ
jgi:hypothetical protein